MLNFIKKIILQEALEKNKDLDFLPNNSVA